MKILLLLTAMICFHAGTNAYSQGITLSLSNAPLQKAFKEIKKQSGYNFIYTREQLGASNPVTITVKNASLSEVLDRCFQSQPLTYSIVERQVIVKYTPVSAKPQTTPTDLIDVRGKVVSAKGEPMPGVTVEARKSGRMTITDSKGEFELKAVKADDVLVLTSAGMEPMQVAVNGQPFLNIVTSPKVSVLDETVVKGYYLTNKRLNTGSVSKLTSEQIALQPVANPLSALQGHVAGIQIQQSTGVPGGAFSVQIRGQNSIASGKNPLYIVDGIPFTPSSLSAYGISGNITGGGSPLNAIDPANIESITILKDADATAIYGSRGANGVVLITTRKGKAGNVTTSISAYTGVAKIARKMKLLNSEQYLKMRGEAFGLDGAMPQSWDYDVNGTWDSTRFTDWQKVLIGGSGRITDIHGSLSGGSPNTQFMVGGGEHYETTVFPGKFGNRRSAAYLNFTHSSADQRLKAIIAASYSVDKIDLINYDLTAIALTLPPTAPAIWDSTGKLNWQKGTFANPFARLLRPYEAKTATVLGNAQLSYMMSKRLELKFNLGYSNMGLKEKSLYPLSSMNPANGATSGYSLFSGSSLQTWIIEPQLHYTRDFRFGQLDILAGTTFQENMGDQQTLYASGFANDALLGNLSAASGIFAFGGDEYQYRYHALFGRIGYNWKNKYLLNATGRRDGSSRFGPGKQFANFGAIGLGWVFSRETGVHDLFPYLSFGKLRLSIGTTGNDQIGNYRYLDTYGPTPRTYQGSAGLYPLRLFNPDYAWEANKKYEVGLDIGLLSDRILLTADWYRNRSSNQLVPYALAPTSGFLSLTTNLPAVVQNTGLEFDLNSTNIESMNFSWITSFNISFPKNKLISFPNLSTSVYAQTYEIGKSLFIVRGFSSKGVNPQTGVYQFNNSKDSSTQQPVYPNDVRGLQSISQDFYGGIGNAFRFGNWQLDVFVQFVKQTGRNYFYGGLFDAPGMFGNQPDWVMNRWQKAGDITTIQRFTQNYGSNAYKGYSNAAYFGDNSIGDASFMRLRNLYVSYTIPAKSLLPLHLQVAKLFLQGQNLLTMTNYQGLDPENNTSPGALAPLRSITGGIQLNF